jgi:hypothetical protein
MTDVLVNATSLLNDYFDGLHVNRPIKVAGIILSLLFFPIWILLMYSIIWYEKYGSDQKRTILNRLTSSICAVCISWCCFIQYPELFCYIFGPLPHWFCTYHYVMKNAIVIQLALFYNTITIMRYLFIFWLKNPYGFNDDFWTFFFNIWIIGFSVLSQSVQAALPGLILVNRIRKELSIIKFNENG